MTCDTLIEMLAQQLNIPSGQITSESSLTEDLGADSLDIVEMLARLEDICGLYIPDEDAVNLQTVGEICTYILNHLEDEHSPEDWNESNE